MTREAGPPSGRSKNGMRLSVAAAAIAMGVAGVFVLVPAKKPALPPEPPQAELTLNVQPENATVLVDGAPSGKQFKHKPGPIRIEVQADGYVPQVVTSSFGTGPQPPQTIALQKAAPKVHMV